jgi:hypothetical protein
MMVQSETRAKPSLTPIRMRDMVARIIRASSEAGLIWIED